MEDNTSKLLTINVGRHPNAKMYISKIRDTHLYLKCSICKKAKCGCLCVCQDSDFPTKHENLPSSSYFEKVNNLTNPEGMILHESNPVQCLELAKLLVLEKVSTISKQYSLIWYAHEFFNGFYEAGTNRNRRSSYVVLLRRHEKTSHIGIHHWNVKNDENENDTSEKQQPQHQSQQQQQHQQQQRQLEIIMDETYIVEQNVSADGENYPKTNY